MAILFPPLEQTPPLITSMHDRHSYNDSVIFMIYVIMGADHIYIYIFYLYNIFWEANAMVLLPNFTVE